MTKDDLDFNVGLHELVQGGLFVNKDGLKLQSGEFLSSFEIAYNTYGRLNSDKSNAILICHALTSDQHVASKHPLTGKSGWWSLLVGPSKPIDTNKYFVICANALGGCMGSTGPLSVCYDDKKIYGLNFPMVTIGDMVSSQLALIDHLGIERLLCVIGGSMGGMQSLQWCAANPSRIKSAIIIASACRHSPQNIALHEVGRQAVMADSNWLGGKYYEKNLRPRKGLAVARMAAHVTYLSENALQNKFGRNLQSRNNLSYGFDADFQIESYLRHQGMSFVDRFDANSYLYLTRAMDYFDLCGDFNSSLQDILGNSEIQFCLLSFSSDWLFPTKMSREISDALAFNGSKVSFVEIESDAGHDSFLLDTPEMFSIIKGFLASIA